jgi:hypothetical protein
MTVALVVVASFAAGLLVGVVLAVAAGHGP